MAEQRAFAARDLSGVDYVYLWADRIYVTIGLEKHKLCLLVMIGVRHAGIAMQPHGPGWSRDHVAGK